MSADQIRHQLATMTVGDIDRLSPREAHELLESMIRCDQKRAIQRFHAFHLFYDPKFETVDTTSATVIPGELGTLQFHIRTLIVSLFLNGRD